MSDGGEGLADVRANAGAQPMFLGVVFGLEGVLTDGEALSVRTEMMPGAADLVVAVATRVPVALASSAPRQLIDAVVEAAGLTPHLTAVVSSEEVPRGEPAPYLSAARLLGHEPAQCLAVEGSASKIEAALAAGMTVVAFPSPADPPAREILDRCAAVAGSLHELQEALLSRLEETPGY